MVVESQEDNLTGWDLGEDAAGKVRCSVDGFDHCVMLLVQYCKVSAK